MEQKKTKSYKMSQDLKERMEKLATESGLPTQEAFLENLTQIYEMNQMKEGVAAGYRTLLEEREYHMKRDHEILITILQSESSQRLELTQTYDEQLEDRSETIIHQEKTIAELEENAGKQEEVLKQLQKENADQIKQNEQLAEISKKDNLLVEEYKEKVDTLSKVVNEYRAAAEENTVMKKQVNQLTVEDEKKDGHIKMLKGQQERLQQQHEEQLHNLTERHKDELGRQQERSDVQRERELLQLRGEYQEKQEKASTAMNLKIEEANARVAELYDTINKLREQLQKLN